MIRLGLVSLLCLLFVAGCQSYHPGYQPNDPGDIRDVIQQGIADNDRLDSQSVVVPREVEQSLLPDSGLSAPKSLLAQQKRFEVSAHDVNAVDFFGSLFRDTPYSVAVHPGVSGTISLQLRDVTLADVLNIVSDMYGYDIEHSGSIYNIYPAGLRTEIFPVNYLMMTRQSTSRTTVNMDTNGGGSSTSSGSSSSSSSSSSSGSSVVGTDIRTESGSDFWAGLQTTLSAMVGSGDGRTVMVSPQSGLVTVRAYPKELREVKKFLNDAQRNLQRQVILEAKILEVTLKDGYQQGINWTELGSNSFNFTTATTGNIPSGELTTMTSAIGGGGQLNVNRGDFKGAITLLKSQGDVNVLSSPRVTALNNQKAVIKVGDNEYFVTSISSDASEVNGSTVTTPTIEMEPFFSGIALDVTPQIDKDGTVTLHIHPAVVDVTSQEKDIDLAGFTQVASEGQDTTLKLPTAKSAVRESDTVVRARDGSVVVIGGLMQTMQEQIQSKTPLLGDIPGLGELFTNKRNVTVKTELVILLKPIVVDRDTWKQQLRKQAELLDKWYPTADGKGG
ncbi:pilus (MSHA type) biogenesis protein MshL [Dongshaea marina]|uniref:pilus (MSHA type) biogenesis protein MshL n=1 Tax=Dongshaea marina TaxID=2047966 RepID=UPI000D3E45BA|nr:pilus (MSHA type) biogenesis protein MshL [Dongshaea marina]